MPIHFSATIFFLSAVFCAAQDAPAVQMLVPGFKVQELPVELSNQNNLRFAPDGSLTALGYDGRVWRLRDKDGDGLEETAEPFWEKETLSVPLGMDWTTKGLLVASKGKISLLKDLDGDGDADEEEILASGWTPTDVGSGGVDATAVTMDADGNIYFGLLVADYSNAYRLRKRKDLKPAEIQWLKERGKWNEPSGDQAGEDTFSLYDLEGKRGTIQKWNQRTRELTTIATGIRVPVALAFNSAGDLFNTDQEGETWMPDGNPFDELNHIQPGKNYGFPPAHPQWLPGLRSELPAAAFGPQHQSACGLVFNEKIELAMPGAQESGSALKHPNVAGGLMHPAKVVRKVFGPKAWEGNAFVAGQSRGKIYRIPLIQTSEGYAGAPQTIARLSMLTVDLAISPRGDLYVSCHSGPPDWGTGPKGKGKIFKISYADKTAPIPLGATPLSPTELRIAFDHPLNKESAERVVTTNSFIEFGEYVSAGDKFETLKPPYAVIAQQDSTPRGRLKIHAARMENEGHHLILTTDPHPLAVKYAATIAGIEAQGLSTPETIYIDYDLTRASRPVLPNEARTLTREQLKALLPWAPALKASGGTDSRSAGKPTGDWEDGRALFFSEKMQCSKCHQIRGEGGLAGPDLSNLIHRDPLSILRDIREPNATLHPDYVTFNVALKNGDSLQGFIRSQEKTSISLMDAEGKITIVERENISSIRPAEISLMPSGLLDGRTEKETRDLLTFLMWVPPQRTREEVAKIVKLKGSTGSDASKQIQVVFVAGKKDHGPGQHDYPRWQTNTVQLFKAKAPKAAVESAWDWPSVEQLKTADVLFFYYWNHNWTKERYSQLDEFLERGGGVVLVHSAVIADKEPEPLAERIGLSAEPGRTGYRHMPFDLQILNQKHPITAGLPERIELLDEPYWPLIGDPKNVDVLASAMVDGAMHPVIWTKEKGKGRVFASIPGHYTWTLDDPLFRIILMRALGWVAHQEPARFEGL